MGGGQLSEHTFLWPLFLPFLSISYPLLYKENPKLGGQSPISPPLATRLFQSYIVHAIYEKDCLYLCILHYSIIEKPC